MKTPARLFTLLTIAAIATPTLMAQQGAPPVGIGAMPNGVEVRSGTTVMRVTALRDDILRVRIGQGSLPEDASWAVTLETRKAQAAVTGTANGFTTSALKLEVTPDLRIIVRDNSGNIISQDAPGRPAQIRDTGAFTIYKQLPADEHFFGLGDKPGPLDRRDEAFTLWNTDAFGWQESTDPLYKAIPFFMAFRNGTAYGIFLDNTWRTSFDFGKADRDAFSFSSDGGPVDYYILAGPTPKDVLRQYAYLTGTAPLPPRWSFGFQQSRYSYYPESQVRDIAARLRKDHIPADALWLDIDYQDRNRPFTVDTKAFPDMPRLVADLKRDGFHLIPITDLHIASTPDDASYTPYKSGKAIDAFVHNPDGSIFVGKVWPGASVFPDFTRKESRDWWGSLYQQFQSWGFAGYWNDMNEPSVFDGPGKTMPLDTVHRIDDASTGFATRNASHREIHNIVGMQQTRGTYDGLRRISPDERPFVMTRASYAGGQRYAVTWTGDNSATWNHLRQTTPQMENIGMSGFPFVGADVGGFASSPQPDLLTKWLEVGAFQPIDRDHSAKGTAPHEPWVNGPHAEDIARRFIETRYHLLPYIYTTAEETSRTGIPMLRPLFVEYPHAAQDGSPLDLSAGGEFLWGADFLVAPPAYPDALDPYFLTLPPGGWYDFWTGRAMPDAQGLTAIEMEIEKSKDPHFKDRPEIKAAIAEAERLQIKPVIDELPVFVRAGAIVPMEALTQNTTEIPRGPLELRVYPNYPNQATANGVNDQAKPCRGSVYWDDGHSYAYQRGEFSRQEFTCEAEQDALRITLGKRDGTYQPWWQQFDIAVIGVSNAHASATDAAGHALPARYDATAHALHILIPADGQAGEVRIQHPLAGK